MATDSSSKLTKFTSSKTIVTGDFANSLFGGLYGSTDGDALDALDPRVNGHVHDGKRSDGHAQKVDLVSHVTNQIRNSNIADDAITRRNIASFSDASNAIPASEVVDGNTYYYLDIDTSTPEYSFTVDGGVVDGDGEGSIVLDLVGDPVNVVAGDGITITTDLSANKFKISTGNAYLFKTISQDFTGGGSSSGSSLVADSPTDTLRFVADDGIDVSLSDSSGTDTVTLKNTSLIFSSIDVKIAAGETGSFTGTTPVDAATISDTLSLEAGYGIQLVGKPSSNSVAFRNQYAMSHTILNLDGWVNGNVSSGWGSTTSRHFTDGDSDVLSYQFRKVNDDDYVYTSVPIPENSFGLRPNSFVFKGYFIVVDQNPGAPYIAVQNPDPTFSVSLEVGSNQTQADNILKGTISDGQDITAGANNIWTTAITQSSTSVADPNKLYVVNWPAQSLESSNNYLGLLFLRMIGASGFTEAGPFDGGINKALVQFIKADIIWYY
jgi:hypothetical protein